GEYGRIRSPAMVDQHGQVAVPISEAGDGRHLLAIGVQVEYGAAAGELGQYGVRGRTADDGGVAAQVDPDPTHALVEQHGAVVGGGCPFGVDPGESDESVRVPMDRGKGDLVVPPATRGGDHRGPGDSVTVHPCQEGGRVRHPAVTGSRHPQVDVSVVDHRR